MIIAAVAGKVIGVPHFYPEPARAQRASHPHGGGSAQMPHPSSLIHGVNSFCFLSATCLGAAVKGDETPRLKRGEVPHRLSPRPSLPSSIMAGAVNVHEAKTRFSKLLKRVQLGEEIIIAKAGKPIARLVPFNRMGGMRKPGSAKRILSTGGDFDAPLPPEIQKAFE
jgi:prevent-host-death family protein